MVRPVITHGLRHQEDLCLMACPTGDGVLSPTPAGAEVGKLVGTERQCSTTSMPGVLNCFVSTQHQARERIAAWNDRFSTAETLAHVG